MKTEKIRPGVYRVIINDNTFMVRGGKNYNPDSPYFRSGRFEIWTAKSEEECTDENCWATCSRSKKECMEILKDYQKNYVQSILDNI